MTQKDNKQTDKWSLLKFDPIVLVLDVAKRWLLILLVALMAGMGAYVYANSSYQPVYQTSMTYVTYNRSSTATVYTNLSAATSVASVFEELLNSSILRRTILRESGLSSFDGSIQAQVIPDTNLLNVTVSGSDPRSVFLVAQAIVEHHESVTYQVIDHVSLELLRSPSVPMAPSNSANAGGLMKKVPMIAAVAMILVLGYLSFQRDTVRSGTEASAKLGCDYLGDIPHETRFKNAKTWLRRNRKSLLITNPLTSFRFVEAFRKLAGRVEYHLHGQKVVMVTSLLENEGKSTLAVNLAMAMALKHEKVLLIDCDLRKLSCRELMEHDKVDLGLCEVLEGRAEPEQAVVRDKKSGLYMLLDNNTTQASGDYLGSQSMRRLLDWARKNYDLVVLDLPPVALVSDAESVMEMADGTVLVVRQNTARATEINKAIVSLEGGKAKLLGCVLNNAHTSGSYGYGYGYGTYGRYRKYGSYGHYGHYDHYGQYGRYNHFSHYDTNENDE